MHSLPIVRRRRATLASNRPHGFTRTHGLTWAILVMLALLATVAGAQDRIVQLNQDDIQRGTVQIRNDEVTKAVRALEIESAAIELTLPSGTPYSALLITVFDEGTNRFWWTFEGAGRYDPSNRIADIEDRFAFYASDQEIVGAQLATPPPSIWISRSSARGESLAKARSQAIATIEGMTAAVESGTAEWQRQVSLWNALPVEVFYDPESAQPVLDLSITAIERQRGGWTVHLAGREDRTAEVQVDRLFNLVSASAAGDASAVSP